MYSFSFVSNVFKKYFLVFFEKFFMEYNIKYKLFFFIFIIFLLIDGLVDGGVNIICGVGFVFFVNLFLCKIMREIIKICIKLRVIMIYDFNLLNNRDSVFDSDILVVIFCL